MNDNICAISSGLINQAISLIRISGPDAQEIIGKIFTGKIKGDKTISYGWILDENKERIDEVLVSCFIGTQNFIGQDTFEINAHGGVVVTNMILELILANGARMANPGEFSMRAFLNGKINLMKAEAINSLIHATTKVQAKAAINKFDGKTSKLIDTLLNKLVYLIGICETNIDYPEYNDVESVENKNLKKKLIELEKEISEIVNLSEQNAPLINGIPVAIVGEPNVGKSSLLNILLQKEKAIVTDVAGTTRDVVEATFLFNGVLFLLKDTAGIRKTKNKIEKIGIEKTIKTIEESKIILHIMDASQKDDLQEQRIKKSSQGKLYIPVYNKSDLLKSMEREKENIYISAINKDIFELENKLKNSLGEVDLKNEKMVCSARHLGLIKSAKIALKDALQAIENGFTADVIITDIRSAWEDLTNINGKADNEKLLDSIFSNFCLGK